MRDRSQRNEQAFGLRGRPLRRPGAIERWWWELRTGVAGQRPESSATWLRTPLFFAACYEFAALEAERQGLYLLANQYAGAAADVLNRATRADGQSIPHDSLEPHAGSEFASTRVKSKAIAT